MEGLQMGGTNTYDRGNKEERRHLWGLSYRAEHRPFCLIPNEVICPGLMDQQLSTKTGYLLYSLYVSWPMPLQQRALCDCNKRGKGHQPPTYQDY